MLSYCRKSKTLCSKPRADSSEIKSGFPGVRATPLPLQHIVRCESSDLHGPQGCLLEGSVITREELVDNILSPSVCSAASRSSVLPTQRTSLGVMRFQCCCSQACNGIRSSSCHVSIDISQGKFFRSIAFCLGVGGGGKETSQDKRMIPGSSPLVSAPAFWGVPAPSVEMTILEMISPSRPVCAACLSCWLTALPTLTPACAKSSQLLTCTHCGTLHLLREQKQSSVSANASA